MSSSSVPAKARSAAPHSWRRVGLFIAAAMFALIAIAAILLLTLDLGRFKGLVTDAATAVLERELRIDGTLSIRVGRNIAIAASDVIIENADWAGDTPLLAIGSVVAEIEVASVVFGPLRFEYLELAGVRAQLVENEAEEVNWWLGEEAGEATDELVDLDEWPFIVEQASFRDIIASVSSPAFTAPLDVRITTFEHSIRDGRLVDRIDGAVNNEPLAVTGSIGPRTSVRRGGPATFDYAGRLGEIKFDARGTFDDIRAPREPLIEFSLQGPNAEYLFRLLNLSESPRGALELQGRLGRSNDRVEFGVSGQVGEFMLDVDGWTSDLATLADGEVAIRAAGPNLDRVAGVFGFDQLPPAPFELGGAAKKSGEEIGIDSLTLAVSGGQFDLHGRLQGFPGLDEAELELIAAGEDIAGFVDLPSSPFTASVSATYADERIHLPAATVTLGEARLGFAGDVEPAGRDTRVDLSIESSVPDLDAFLSRIGVAGAPPVATRVAARVEHGGGATRITDIEGQIGEAEVTGSLALEGHGEQLTASFDVGLRSPRLDTLLPATPAFAAAPVPVDLQSSGTYAAGRLEQASLRATIGDASLEVQGSLVDIREMTGGDLLVKAEVPDLAAIGSSERFAIPALPMSVAGGITGTRGAWSANDVVAILGDSRLQANLSYTSGDVPVFVIDATAARIDLRNLLPEPVSRTAVSEQAQDRVIPDIDLPVDRFSRMNLTASLDVHELLTHRLELRDVVLDGTIRDGRLRIDTLDIRGSRGHVVGEVDYGPRDGTWSIAGDFSGDNLKLAQPGEPEDVVRARPTYALESGFSGQGTNLRAILSSLDGHLLLHGGSGLAPDTGGFLGDVFFGDFATQLLDVVNPFTRIEETIQVRCAVLMLNIEDGIISGDPALVLQTKELNIFARGQVDLDTEAMKISINTAARKGIGIGFSDIVSPYTIVRGTLASPTLSLSEKDVLFQGGAAVATGGLTILARGLKNRFLSDKDPCKTALETYRKAAKSSE